MSPGFCILFALLFGATSLLCAAGEQAGEPNLITLSAAGHRALQQGSDEESMPLLLSATKLLEQCVRLDRANAVRRYDLAVAEQGAGALFQQHGDKPSAVRWLDRAIADVQRAISLDRQSADAHTLLADLYGAKIGLEGFWAAVRLGSKANDETQTALRLDPNNPRVQLTLGRRYLYSPKMFGGDLDRAVASFKQATVLDPRCDEAFRWLAIAFARKNNRAAARAALAEALRLNPRCRSTQRLLQEDVR